MVTHSRCRIAYGSSPLVLLLAAVSLAGCTEGPAPAGSGQPFKQDHLVLEGRGGRMLLDCRDSPPSITISNAGGEVLAILDGNGAHFYEEGGDWLATLGIERLGAEKSATLSLKSPRGGEPGRAVKRVSLVASSTYAQVTVRREDSPTVVRMRIDDHEGEVGARWNDLRGRIVTSGVEAETAIELQAPDAATWRQRVGGR